MQRYLLLLTFLLFFFGYSSAQKQHFNDKSFVVADFSNGVFTSEDLKSTIEKRIFGMCLSIEKSSQQNSLIIKCDQEDPISFEWFLNELNLTLEKYPSNVIPVFIKCDEEEDKLISTLKKTNIYNKIFHWPKGEEWPTVKDIIAQKKNALFFIFNDTFSDSTVLMKASEHITEFSIPSPTGHNYIEHTLPHNIALPLLMVNVNHIKINNERTKEEYQNPEYQTYLLQCWQSTGKKPNFVFKDGSPYGLLKLGIKLTLQNAVKGKVTLNNVPLQKVFWKNPDKCISNSNFSFPVTQDKLFLNPSIPGYQFLPSTLEFKSTNLPKSDIHIQASRLPISKNLEAHFSFEKTLKNIIKPNEKITGQNYRFAIDTQRGEVLKLIDSAYVNIGLAKDYKLTGNSFTISSWIKPTTLSGQKTFTIIGTDILAYRKSMQLKISEKTPYFSFYYDGIQTNDILQKDKWYHLTGRYNVENGEQAIFLNGELIVASKNHISFIGEKELLIGYSFKKNNFFKGYIDDVSIWSRALSNEEIKKIAIDSSLPEYQQPKQVNNFTIVLLIAMGIIILALLYKLFSPHKHKEKTHHQNIIIPAANNNETNSIYFFGDFSVLNKSGENISSRFALKLRELFLLISFYTLEYKKGITTEQLTDILWPDVDKIKARNSRGVSLNKLRKLISEVEGLEILFEDGFWKLELSSSTYFDIFEVKSLLSQTKNISVNELLKYYNIVKRGKFLQDCTYEWLDKFKGHVSNEVIDYLSRLTHILDRSEHKEVIENVAQRILSADDMNEEALHLQISLLIEQGKENIARFTFEEFCTNYQKIYGEPFSVEFDTFVKK